MKLYQFNPETGVYAGELFETQEMVGYCEGVTAVAPPAYAAGEVPVYDMASDVWRVLPAAEFRQNIVGLAAVNPGKVR